MAMALLCRRKGFFRYQLCGRLFSSYAAPNPSPIASSSSFLAPVLQHRSNLFPMMVSSFLRISERRFSAEATTYPTPAPPPVDFDDFPEAGDGGDYDEDGGEDEDPAPDPDDGALYSPSESEN